MNIGTALYAFLLLESATCNNTILEQNLIVWQHNKQHNIEYIEVYIEVGNSDTECLVYMDNKIFACRTDDLRNVLSNEKITTSDKIYQELLEHYAVDIFTVNEKTTKEDLNEYLEHKFFKYYKEDYCSEMNM